MMTYILVSLATFLSPCSLIPQLYRVYKRKSAEDISYTMILMFMFCSLAWLPYAIEIKSTCLMIGQSLNGCFESALLAQKVYYSKKRAKKGSHD